MTSLWHPPVKNITHTGDVMHDLSHHLKTKLSIASNVTWDDMSELNMVFASSLGAGGYGSDVASRYFIEITHITNITPTPTHHTHHTYPTHPTHLTHPTSHTRIPHIPNIPHIPHTSHTHHTYHTHHTHRLILEKQMHTPSGAGAEGSSPDVGRADPMRVEILEQLLLRCDHIMAAASLITSHITYHA